MKNPRTVFIVFFLLLPPLAGIFLGSVNTARAADNCIITSSDLDAVTAAAAQGLMAELAARRALLTRTIACAKAEAQSLQNNLNGLSVSDDEKTIRAQLSDRLNDAMNYYDLELEKVGGAGITGTQIIAKEVFAWRGNNYNFLAAQVANFTLWVKSQNLFETALARLRSVESIVSFLEQAGAQNELRSNLASAQVLVQAARNKNDSARNAFLQSLPPDQTLALIQQSLQSLSDAYQKFFDISTVVQTLLPIKP
ncbi:MAG: hypothetical protein ABSC29_00440 [Minisyncoccia bacterium]